MITKYILKLSNLVLLFGISIQVLAQDQKIIPASAEASALAKAINFPVGYNTGVPNISIPLYEIKTPGGLSLPVVASYNAGGFKINEKSTSVGLGWTLSTSLQISRSVNGKDDLSGPVGNSFSGYYYRDYFGPSSIPLTGKDYRDLVLARKDEQPDAFYYTLLNKSGTFYFYKSPGQPTKAVTIPYTGVKIQLIANNCFKITDTDGTVYWFGRNNENPSSATAIERTIHEAESFVSAWKCVAIVNPSKTDVIQFEYSSRGKHYTFTHQDRIELLEGACRGSSSGSPPPNTGHHIGGQGIYYPKAGGATNWVGESTNSHQLRDTVSIFNVSSPKYFNYSTGWDEGLHVIWKKDSQFIAEDTRYSIKPLGHSRIEPRVDVEDLQLSRITFRGGELRYNLVGGIVDNLGFQTSTARLQSIEVYNNANTLIKTISFTQTEAGSCSISPYPGVIVSPTRYLDALKISKSSTGPSETYAFSYKNKYCFNNLKGSDSWGGVNGSTRPRSEGSSVPEQMLESPHIIGNNCNNEITLPFMIGYGDKLVNPDLAQSGILTKIKYPTGGLTEFEYGSNKYRYDNAIHLAGGLRVEKIKYYDGKSPQPINQKIFRYGEMESGTGTVMSVPSMATADYGGYKYTQTVSYGSYSGFAPDYTWHGFAQETKTTFTSDSFLDLFYTNGSAVSYPEVAEYQADKGGSTGKTIYRYSSGYYLGYSPAGTIPGTNLTMQGTSWDIGKLSSETHLKKDVNGDYNDVWQKIYYYTPLYKENISVGKTFQLREYQTDNGGGVPDEIYSYEDFIYYNYQLKSGAMLLTTETESWKDGITGTFKSTQYKYGDALQVKEVTVTQSDGEKLITKTTYPEDYTSGSVFANNLKDNYMLNSPVEKILIKEGTNGSKVISGEITTYFADGTGLPDKSYQLDIADPILISAFQPSNTSGFNPDTHYKEKAAYVYDELKNLATIQVKDDIATSYHWEYIDKTYPVAECKNALATEFFYNGFNNSYQSGDYQVTFSIPTARAYVYSYRYLQAGIWHYSGEQTYTGWVWLTEGDAIDDVRVYPKDAQLSTYTYDPLVGMTSATDPKGQITFYEYDDLGRLKNIKDQRGNIIKNYCYNYAGQLTDCNIPVAAYSNELKAGVFYKNDCPDGEGLGVTYRVPAGMYTSSISVEDANAKADADMFANGQNYANMEGECPLPTTNEEIDVTFLESYTYYTLDGQHRGTVYARFYDKVGNPLSVTNLDFVYYKYSNNTYDNDPPLLLYTYTMDNVNGYGVLISSDELLYQTGATWEDGIGYYFQTWLD